MGTFAAPQGLDPVGQPGDAVTGGTEVTALRGPQFTAEAMWLSLNWSLNSLSTSNYYGYSGPRMDEALADRRLATSVEQQRPILARMRRILDDNPFAANLAAIEESAFSDDSVGGVARISGSTIRFDKAYVTNL